MRSFQIVMTTGLLMGLLLSVTACQSSPEPAGEPSAVPAAPPVEEVESEPAPPPEPEEPTEEQRAIAEQITDEDLSMFAAGVRALGEREQQLEDEGRDYDTRRAQASHPAEVIQIEQDVLAEMQDALAEEGLEWESFMQFGGLIRSNPILMERLEDHLDPEEIDYFFGT